VRHAVAQLPEKLRAIMDLHLDGMEHEQIAADLGVPITSVYAPLPQVKAVLRGLLEQDGHRW